MQLNLICHPDFLGGPVRGIYVQMTRVSKRKIGLRYQVDADEGALLLPNMAQPVRTDNLWQHSCFEIFLREADQEEYYEYNFSPSSQWAAYQFTSYRTGMQNIAMPSAPQIDIDAGSEYFGLDSVIELPAALANKTMQFNITCVIEHADGTKSYWALAHAKDAPDFHDRDCFIGQMEAAL